jgi:polysaccharide export outer membrane protein
VASARSQVSSRLHTCRRRALSTAGLIAAIAGLAGCEADSFIDPSVVGRWENTPTVMPILDRLSAIEDEPTEYVQSSPIQANDLVPEVEQYRFGPGDQLEIRIRDFFQLGVEELFDRVVDQRGYVDLPRLAPIRVIGKTNSELTTAIENGIRDRQIAGNPVVAVNVRSQRKQTFAVLGAVQTPGTFFIPAPDYRLLEAITTAGGVNETIPFVYVIRQVPLTDAAAGRLPEPEPTRRDRRGRPPVDVRPENPAQAEPAKGEDLINLIDEIAKPVKPADKPSPGMLSEQPGSTPVRIAQPAIDLPDSREPQSSSPVAAAPNPDGPNSNWVFVDGQWIKSAPSIDPTLPSNSTQQLVTQRVIKIPVGPLLAGDASANIVIRPGDVVRIPVPRGGLVYMSGQVLRPGPYNLPTDGKLTLQRAIDAAGGLTGIAIPEKLDLTRMVGKDRQATIRLNYRAIGEQTQPDIYLKPDDRINIGTNFWATPLAVIRGGFRTSYGFGFLLDRNFDEDVFGPRQDLNR